MRKIIYILLSLYLITTGISAQKSVGEWTSYLAYYTTDNVSEGNNHIFAVANGSLYSYNKEDNSIIHYSKQTGLNDNDINHISFNPTVNTLLITYSNGNIDLLGEDGIYNISSLLDNSSITDKTINNIYLDKELAYLSTNFGVIALDMSKKEIKDTYKLNKNIYAVAINSNFIYAATSEGLVYASLDSNLLDYNVWTSYPLSTSEFDKNSISQICFFQDNLCLFVNQTDNKGIYYQQKDGTINNLLKNNSLKSMVLQNNKLIFYTNTDLYIYSSLSDKDIINVETINGISSVKDPNTFWIASGTNGIKGIQKKNNKYEIILENTNSDTEYPKRNFNYFMTTYDNKLYIVGGYRWTDRIWRAGTLMIYDNEKWFNLDEYTVNKQTPEYCQDYTGVAVDPRDPSHYYVSTYGEGIIEFKDNQFVQLFHHKNSPLETIYPDGNKTSQYKYIRIGGVTFDKKGNLWATNCSVKDAIKVLKADGTWSSLYYSDFTNVNMADKITITSDNKKWINVPYSDDASIYVINDNNTIDDTSDDQTRRIKTFIDINGTIDVSGYFCVTEDKNGQIWVGTNRGPIIVTNSSNLDQIRGTRIIREGADGPYYLLDGEQINAIAVDGGNRKWIATQSSGVFLVSEDGLETIHNFTTANSPLPSNQINSLAINEQTGEVFIGTEKGLVSYMGDATEGSEDYSDVYAYPNPVRPEYNDHVTIVGLMENSNVKITDLKGNIIYQGKSAGGTFTWDCRSRKGGRVATGVYLVLSATPEAKESVVTKIMVVK